VSYADFLARKTEFLPVRGFESDGRGTHLYPYQQDLVRRALAAGRYALFCDTGTGKTAMQIDWARQVSARGRVLILTPLAVAQQTVREAERFGVEAVHLREDRPSARIVVTNYEMLSAFDSVEFAGVVLDESSILKSFTGRMRTDLIRRFAQTPFRLCASATPSPNDHMELGNHSEFLGIKTRAEMLSEFFVHDGGSTSEWRIKGHAQHVFWRWVCGWAAAMRRPSDMGYSDEGFALPELRLHTHILAPDHCEARARGLLFELPATGLSDQRAARKASIGRRVEIARMIAGEPGPCVIWCELNSEGEALRKAMPWATEIKGSDDAWEKVERLCGFADGRYRVLVTKPSIAGFGMNWQHCARMVFMGQSHSFEQTYQAIRRCWRYGQTLPVDVHTIASEQDRAIAENVGRKATEHAQLIDQMIKFSNHGDKGSRWNSYTPRMLNVEFPRWMSNLATDGSSITETASR
jgi:hypothetical protein